MTFKQKLIGIIVASLGLLGIGTGTIQFAGVGDSTVKFSDVGNMGTSGPMFLAQSVSTQMIGTSTSREVVRIANLSTNPIYCNANGDKPALAYSGILVMGSTTLQFDEQLPYTGGIRCISPFGAASTTVYARQGN